jgi:hypothetical protein
LLAIACSNGPSASNVAPIASGAADSARTAACATSGTSLLGVATQLRALDANSDTSSVSSAIDTLIGNLNAIQATGAENTARSAAVTQLQNVKSALSDPQTRTQAAATTAGALDAARQALC